MNTIKYFLLFILLSLMTIPSSYSQFKMVDPANEWNIAYTISNLPYSWKIYTERYTFSQDSVLLDGEYYHELLSTRSETGSINYKTGTYLRQEGKKVWIKESKTDSAILLYDFSLQLKDTFAFKYTENYTLHTETLIVDDIDTLIMVDESERKHFILNNIQPPGKVCQQEWIEGIGVAYNGFLNFNNFCFVDVDYGDLLCFKHNGKMVYQNPYVDSCYVVRTATESPELADLKLYPNPTSDKLSFNTEYKIKSVEIYDLMGHKIKEISFPGKAIDIGMYQAGVYFIHIRTANGYRGVRKFIIN